MSIRKSCFAIFVAMLLIARSALPLANAGQNWSCPIKGSCCKTMCPMKTHVPQAMPLLIRFAVVDERVQLFIDHTTIDYASATPPHPLRGFRFDREEPPRHFSLV
jgi:hypothetical protein